MLRLPPVVEVWWDDAHFQVGEVEEEDAYKMHRPWEYVTTGYLVQSDDAGVTVSQDVSEDGGFRGRTFIPRAMVRDEHQIRASRNWPRKRKPAPSSDPAAPA